jgi:hypothetical protein
MSSTKAAPKPKANIRRFDIFAEYKRQEAIRDGQAADVAKGYGLWVAKVVAARRFGKKKPAGETGESQDKPKRRAKWHKLDEKPQTDKLFDKEIVARMGVTFYRQVFSPAIRKAIADGSSYEAIRDTLRAQWKPES